MIFLGSIEFVPNNENCIVYNVSYNTELYPKIDLLPDFSNQILIYDELEEQITNKCVEYIFNKEEAFLSLVNIMVDVYDDLDVYLIVDTSNEYVDFINETLKNIIEVRYGYPVISIYDFEDYENLIRDPNLYTMSRDGLVNFDQDKDLYYYKIAEKNGGII